MKAESARAILKRREDLEKERKEVFKKIVTDFWAKIAVQMIQLEMSKTEQANKKTPSEPQSIKINKPKKYKIK
jgi:hypothetical protein